MFLDIGPLELLALAVLGVIIFGPDKLPQAAATAARMLRQFRDFAHGARADLKKELGPEFENFNLEDLNPRTFIRKNLLGDDDVLGLRDLNLRELNLRELGLDEDPLSPSRRLMEPSPKLAPGESAPYDVDAT